MNKIFSNIAYVCGLIVGLVITYNSLPTQPDMGNGIGGAFQGSFDRIFGSILGIIIIFAFSVLLVGGILESRRKNKLINQEQKIDK